MDKLILCLLFSVLTGCAAQNVVMSKVQYDYYVPAKYPITNKHQYIHVSIDDPQLKLPEVELKYDALKIKYSQNRLNAQIIAYVHILSSFLVQRAPITRQIIEYDENNKGTVMYVMTNRGFIRTPYSIEVIDVLNDKLIFQTQGAANFPIDALPKPSTKQTTEALTQEFYQQRSQARIAVMDDIWKNLKGRYLQDIQVSFSNMEFSVVSEYEGEPDFNKAYNLLKKNSKSTAKQALTIYNQALKRYENKEDEESKRISNFLNQGITAASKIANDSNPQRY